MLGKNKLPPLEFTPRVFSRRELFTGFFRHAQPNRSQLRIENRPPFAAPEHLFQAACDGCGKCVTACPMGVIDIRRQQAVLDLTFSACTLCGKCAENCPTQALHLSFKKDTELRPQFSTACLHTKGQPCDSCIQSCPQQAISPELTINHDLCNGCGECKQACFMAAVSLKGTN
ncbi:ferredoxin-type protein NapF [Actinobacillus pleuropneumoniae]|uniref:Ferredoxin n=2 Tax=Actinobacillus pleuropneumoniae TaxID=715 RepID=A0A3S4YBT4_ACTPL|nr:ferredoxin-type protein NapF [Actinobacillus pleuropneumoniae]ACE62390.1 putative ferredoxin [Actinobacillus pleuropneumoniae serovar 7 str. AP76]EFL77614.1 ferredoxin [Actinobacillus pleuropneumoniae serovar 2 str. 4226]EFM86842.1 Ferredoxin [Actinobacillus pleuropneumoniae serovar 2 str. S1536]EFN02072.1 Ferredoxin [Actinobacillus pleuropneumoniae serovar 13 str. N273]MEE3619068.1 ferredoxin-type protein NapF [Actinobacillus pleuropneumoniae]